MAKRQNLFRLKLELCSVRYNFADPTTARDREIKRQTLLELIKFTNTPSGQKVFCDSSMPHVLKMLEANIFREMPAECQDLDMEEEELPVQSEWPHLQAVYEFMLRFIVSAEVKPKIARKHLHRNFCKNIIALFDSEDPRERDYLKTILHRIYGKFMTYRSLIRRHIQYVFYEFLFEKGQHNGIGELLEILGSIINGFQLPLKKEHLEFLAHTLIPLHKTTSIQFYHLQLSYCMTQYIEKDRNTAIPIVLGILKFWPWSSTSKQLLLFNELEDIMELISPTVLERVVSVGRVLWQSTRGHEGGRHVDATVDHIAHLVPLVILVGGASVRAHREMYWERSFPSAGALLVLVEQRTPGVQWLSVAAVLLGLSAPCVPQPEYRRTGPLEPKREHSRALCCEFVHGFRPCIVQQSIQLQRWVQELTGQEGCQKPKRLGRD